MLPHENRNLRNINVLPAFLAAWYNTTPAEATAVIEAAVQEQRIRLDSDGGHSFHDPHYLQLLHKDDPDYDIIMQHGPQGSKQPK